MIDVSRLLTELGEEPDASVSAAHFSPAPEGAEIYPEKAPAEVRQIVTCLALLESRNRLRAKENETEAAKSPDEAHARYLEWVLGEALVGMLHSMISTLLYNKYQPVNGSLGITRAWKVWCISVEQQELLKRKKLHGFFYVSPRKDEGPSSKPC